MASQWSRWMKFVPPRYPQRYSSSYAEVEPLPELESPSADEWVAAHAKFERSTMSEQERVHREHRAEVFAFFQDLCDSGAEMTGVVPLTADYFGIRDSEAVCLLADWIVRKEETA